jgi:hypothetical protein
MEQIENFISLNQTYDVWRGEEYIGEIIITNKL